MKSAFRANLEPSRKQVRPVQDYSLTISRVDEWQGKDLNDLMRRDQSFDCRIRVGTTIGVSLKAPGSEP